MANDRWNAWRKANPKTIPDLRDGILRRADLCGADLHDADLRRAVLTDTQARNANLWDADLSDANLRGADLSDANLMGASLRGADLEGDDMEEEDGGRLIDSSISEYHTRLVGASLYNADLSLARLQCADLHGANLYRANLNGASLYRATLTKAHLVETNLSGADLGRTDLREATVNEAQLSGARIGNCRLHGTVFANVNLTTVSDLDTVEHLGPSSVDTHTLALSNGRIPRAFLRGCGLSEWEIAAVELYDSTVSAEGIAEIQTKVHHLRAGAPIQIKPIFLSYSHQDGAFVDRVAKALDTKHVRYWHDKKDVTSGRIDEVLSHALALHPTALIVLSESSVERPWVEFEVDTAVENGAKLCPIAVDNAWLTSERMSGHLRTQLKKHIVLDFSDPDQFDVRFDQLWTGLVRYYGAGGPES